jgi:hypothetical protein
LWVIFALLDPDPLTRLNPDPIQIRIRIRIRIRNPACVASTLLVRLTASSFLDASARVKARTSPTTAINSLVTVLRIRIRDPVPY